MMGFYPAICELDPSWFYDDLAGPCDGPTTEEFRQVNTRRLLDDKVVPRDSPGIWRSRCERHAKMVDRELNESRRID